MKILKTIALISLVSAGMTTAYAANDGTLTSGGGGTTSKGDFLFSVIRQDAVQITEMTDITITTSGTATGSQSQSDGVCYYATTAGYTVDIDSTNNFSLISGSNNMGYSIVWSDNGTDRTFATNTTNPSALPSQNTTDATCGGSTNATVEVRVIDTEFDGKPVGTYTDTVFVTIALQ